MLFSGLFPKPPDQPEVKQVGFEEGAINADAAMPPAGSASALTAGEADTEGEDVLAPLPWEDEHDPYVPLSMAKLPRTPSPLPRVSLLSYHAMDDLTAPSLISDRKGSVVSMASESEARSRRLTSHRRELERRTNEALKRQKSAAAAKAKTFERARASAYQFGLNAWEKSRILEDDQLPTHKHSMPRAVAKAAQLSDRSNKSSVAARSAAARSSTRSACSSLAATPRSDDGKYILSSARGDIDSSRPGEEEVRQREMVEAAFKRVRAANEGVLIEQQKLRQAATEARNRKYREAQAAYARRQAELKKQAETQRDEHTEKVATDRSKRQAEAKRLAEERRRRAEDRLKLQARQAKEEQEHDEHELQLKRATQARYTEARHRKEAQAEAKAIEVQKEIVEERTRDKAAQKKFEEAQQRRRNEWLAASRKAKRLADEEAAKKLAADEEREKAAIRAKFKASEAQRTRREAEKKAQEKEESRKVREAHKKKLDEEREKVAAEKREKAAALKQALREAAAMQFEADERGKMRLKADPAKELQKKMRALEEERDKAMRERDAEIAAKEVALEKRKKREAHQRQLQVEAAQREVAKTFKENRDKELADRLAREAAEKERYQRLAREAREKLDEDNRIRIEKERQMAANLKEMKTAQYEAELAASKRAERMHQLKVRQYRHLQEVAREDQRRWEVSQQEEHEEAQVEAERTFAEERAYKRAEAEEMRLLRLYVEQKMRLDMEEKRAQRIAQEAEDAEFELDQEAAVLRAAAAEVKRMKEARQVGSRPGSRTGTPREGSKKGGIGSAPASANPFETLGNALNFSLLFSSKKKGRDIAFVEEVRV